MIPRYNKDKDLIKINIACNTLTNPLLNLLLILFNIRRYLIILEVAVVLVEGFIYSKVGKLKLKESLGLSLGLNVTSYFIGYLIN